MNHGNEPIFGLASEWSKAFASALEAMADEKPQMTVQPGAAAAAGDLVWWKQVFDASPGAAVWIGTDGEACAVLGKQILSAAGIESADKEELKGTYLEVVRQSLGSFASYIGAQIGGEVTCTEGSEEAPPGDKTAGCAIAIRRAEGQLPSLVFLINREMLEAVSRTAVENETGNQTANVPEPGEPERQELSARASSTLDLLMDVELPVSVSFGRTQVRMQEILKLITGSIIELDRAISEPVEVIDNNCVVARGEVVVVDGNYGVRINEVMSRQERLQESRRFLLPAVAHRR